MTSEQTERKADKLTEESDPEAYHDAARKLFDFSDEVPEIMDYECLSAIQMQHVMILAIFLESRAVFTKLKQLEKKLDSLIEDSKNKPSHE